MAGRTPKKPTKRTPRRKLRVAPAVDDRRAAFLRAIAQCANVTMAAESVGIDRSTHYHWLADADYRRRFLSAREAALDRLEYEAWQRAIGRSDRLLMFLLSAYRPRFRNESTSGLLSGDELAEVPERQLLEQAEAELRELGYASLSELWESGP